MPSISLVGERKENKLRVGLAWDSESAAARKLQAFSILEVSDSSIAFQVSRGHVLWQSRNKKRNSKKIVGEFANFRQRLPGILTALTVGIPRDMYLTCLTRRSVNGGARTLAGNFPAIVTATLAVFLIGAPD